MVDKERTHSQRLSRQQVSLKVVSNHHGVAGADTKDAERMHAMRLLRQGRTTIIIAHRLATVRDADRIIVLRAGRVVEQGSHDELSRRPGLYAQLLASSHTSFDESG